MTYEDEVVNAAKDGLAWANVAMSPEMEKLFRVVFQCGYKQGKLDQLKKHIGVEE